MKKLPLLLLGLVFLACNSQVAEKPEAKAKATPEAKAQLTKAPTNATKEGINWLSFEEAQAATKKSARKVIVDVYTPWCGPCKMMDARTFSDPKVASFIDENFYAVKFNAESPDAVTFKGKKYDNPNFDPNRSPRGRNAPHTLTRTMKLRGYPTLVVYDPEFNIVEKIVGFKTPDQLMKVLNKLAS